MDEPTDGSLGAAPQTPFHHDRLDSWKQIAAYLGRGVTTVQRWEQEESLPIHRLPHAKKGSVFAYREELDAWLATRAQAPASTTANDSKPRRAGGPRHVAFPLAAGLALMALVWSGLVWRSRSFTAPASSAERAARVLPRPLVNTPALEGVPSLSPDGTEVVYRVGGGRPSLYTRSVAGGPPRPLTIEGSASSMDATRPAWSPRGDLIAFLSVEAESKYGLHLISPRGGAARYVTSIAGTGLCWSPDGTRIGFVDRNSVSEPFSVFSMPVEGGARHRLTVPPRASFGDTHCAFSPDGRSLAVARFVTRHESHLHVLRIDAGDGSTSEQLTDSLNGIDGIAWTPDGEAVVVAAAQGLWKIAATGRRGPPLLIAGLEGQTTSPTFSRPAGARPARLAYAFRQQDVNVWRWTGNDRSETIARLTDSTSFDDFPALSPDGKSVAYASNRTSVNELWVAAADGSDARQITFHRGPLVMSPRWSPDGRHLAFSSETGGNRDIYVIAADGSSSERVTSDPSDEGNPSWSRDGRWIYFRSDRGGFGQIWKVPRGGGRPFRVTSGEASQGFESPDGRVLYFTRNVDTTGIWAIPVAGGQETHVLPDVREGFWDVADAGIMYILSRLGNNDGTFDVRMFTFSTRTSMPIARLRPTMLPLFPGFSVSHDARTVLWCQADSVQSDVMLIDPWIP